MGARVHAAAGQPREEPVAPAAPSPIGAPIASRAAIGCTRGRYQVIRTRAGRRIVSTGSTRRLFGDARETSG